MYITERAVFQLTDKGLVLTEYAPGVDLEKDIFAHMPKKPLAIPDLKEMDAPHFPQQEKNGLGQRIKLH